MENIELKYFSRSEFGRCDVAKNLELGEGVAAGVRAGRGQTSQVCHQQKKTSGDFVHFLSKENVISLV